MTIQDVINNLKMCAFELSNLCVYSYKHKKCKAHHESETIILSSRIVYSVIDKLLENGYKGEFLFNVYNEPLIDPRLFMFIKYIKEKNDNQNISIWSNGWYCDGILLDELQEIGVTQIVFSAYTDKECERLSQFSDRVGVEVRHGVLDDRLDLFNYPVRKEYTPCNLPKEYLVINSRGDVVLCCFDTTYNNSFGNLYTDNIENVLLSDTRLEACELLSKGDRSRYECCKRCFFLE